MKKFVSIIAILIVVICMNSNVHAITAENLQNSLNTIQSQKQAAQNRLNSITQENASVSKQIEDISSKITSYQNQITDLNDQISNLQITIDQTKAELTAASAQYDKQQQILQNRLVALYENGDVTYLDVLVNSSSLANFLSNYYLVSEVAAYDTDLLDQMQKNKDQIQNTQNNLEAQQNSLESRKNTLQAMENSLTVSKSEIAAKMNTLSAEGQALQQQINQYNQDAANITSQIAAINSRPVQDGNIVTVAKSQLGNVGGEPYWSWYGYSCHVEWCACFVSWCANQCGYISTNQIPMFSYCPNGVSWFKSHGLWQDGGTVPKSGDIIFFCRGNSGISDHVGIVEKVSNGMVYTIEGNSSNACRERQYSIDNSSILGYGMPKY